MFGIQLPQINIPNPFAGVQQTVDNTVTMARNDISGAGTILSSDVTSLYNIGRNVESNYVSPIVASGEQGANRVITAGNNLAAAPGNVVRGAEETIYNAGQTFGNDVRGIISTAGDDINNFFAGPGNAFSQKENEFNDYVQKDVKLVDKTVQDDLAALDKWTNDFFTKLGLVTVPVANAGVDISKYLILAVGGIVLIVIFLLFWGSRPRGRHS